MLEDVAGREVVDSYIEKLSTDVVTATVSCQNNSVSRFYLAVFVEIDRVLVEPVVHRPFRRQRSRGFLYRKIID